MHELNNDNTQIRGNLLGDDIVMDVLAIGPLLSISVEGVMH